jgi:hypothetical protein
MYRAPPRARALLILAALVGYALIVAAVLPAGVHHRKESRWWLVRLA